MKKRFAPKDDCPQCDRLSRRNEELERQIKSLEKQFRRLTHRIADLEVENVEITLELNEELQVIADESKKLEEKANVITLMRPDGKIVEFKKPPPRLGRC